MSVQAIIEQHTLEPKPASGPAIHVRVATAADLTRSIDDQKNSGQSREVADGLRWLAALGTGLRHEAYCIHADRDERIVGSLPLLFVRSALFGRFLVSLPYVSTAGVQCDSLDNSTRLIDRAVQLADELNVRYLELRHERPLDHPSLTHQRTDKVHMRLALPATADELWASLKAKVRNQIRKGDSSGLSLHWGTHDLLDDFYDVFSRNMRDLGTPVFAKGLFGAILSQFQSDAELCVVRQGKKPIAGAILIHGATRTQVPSASSLRRYNATNANMWMYWHLLRRAVERGQAEFDFGRSTEGGNTYRFKKQWGAEPHPSAWQYYVRRGTIGDLRPDNPKYRLVIEAWQRLPLLVTRLIGPAIIRGVP
jgi:FemAB-related protein (PEP-CTERM system-associated)